MISNINTMTFPDFNQAWEGINEWMVNNEEHIKKSGGGIYGSEMVCYDNIIHIEKNFFNPKFNFGKVLGYRYKKWSKLVNNYVNMDYLDLVKSEVVGREKKTTRHYTYTFHFDNSHGSGKDCLISLTFSRRRGKKVPTVVYTTRASEVTSRLIFDFLLIQRIVEYVYGKGVEVEIICYIPMMFLHLERFAIYIAWKGKEVVLKDPKKYVTTYGPFQQRCFNIFDKFSTQPPEEIKYKVHKRTAMQIQKDENGKSLSGAPKLLARDLVLLFNQKLRQKEIDKLNTYKTT